MVRAFDGDANGDGISNGLAFLLGASGPGVNALNKLPVPDRKLRWSQAHLPDAARQRPRHATLSLEHSNTLATGSWTTLAVPDSLNTVGDVVFTITGTNPLNVTATIPVSKAAGWQTLRPRQRRAIGSRADRTPRAHGRVARLSAAT
jgi:hypothetical protein